MNVLIIDENMPGMNGSQCVKILKELISKKFLCYFKIYSMGMFDQSTIQDFKKFYGFDGFLSKPLTRKNIESEIDILKR